MLLQPRSWIGQRDRRPGSARIRLSAAHDEWNHVGIALAGIELGFFAEEGLDDVELVTFPEEDTAELIERERAQVDLLCRGIVDIGIDPRTTFILEARNEGKPACIVAARRKNHAFVLVGQRGMKSIEELRGQTIQESQRGGATDVMMRQVLKDHGLEPEEDVRIVYTGGPMHNVRAQARAFMEGRAGPAMLSPTAELEGIVAAGFPVLLDLRELYPSRHDRVTGANERFVEEHPDLLKGFLRGMIRSCRWVLDGKNGPRFKEIILQAGFLRTEREAESFDDLFAGWQTRGTRDLDLPRDGIELIVDEQKRAGALPGSFRLEDVLRLDMLHEAQAELAEA